MKRTHRFFSKNNLFAQRGSMLVELLMSIALAAIIMPFIFRYQQSVITRAENIAITERMSDIQDALERYILDNRTALLNTVGRNIVRINLSDLVEYGLGTDLATSPDYQLRILKSNDITGQATLQGVIIFSSDEIDPLRTREIVALGGETMGFIDGTHAYGTFGAWRTNTLDIGVDTSDGIIELTDINRDSSLYLWRVPSDNASDAMMLSGLNMGGHDITNASFFNASAARFDETLVLGTGAASSVIFQNRATLDNVFESTSATIAGILSSDSRTMEVSGNFSLADLGKFTSLTTGDLWASNMTLGGLSISSDLEGPAILKVNRNIDLTSGRVDAMYVTVGFAGSITPRLVVSDRIEDSTNPNYYWDVYSGVANMMDVSLQELARMATDIRYLERDDDTDSVRIFNSVSSNPNATASDYMNAIKEMQNTVRMKYQRLNLE